jgi:hypothetical protein
MGLTNQYERLGSILGIRSSMGDQRSGDVISTGHLLDSIRYLLDAVQTIESSISVVLGGSA